MFLHRDIYQYTWVCCLLDSSLSRCRLSLLEEWRGIRDQALSDLSGIEGCIFVHASGFIGGNKTKEGALEMARRTMQASALAPTNGST